MIAFHSDRVYFPLLIIISVTVHLLLLNHYGIRLPEDAIAYLNSADSLIHNGYFTETEPNHIFYSSYLGFLSLLKLCSLDVSQIIYVQIALSTLAYLALYKASEKLFDSKTAGLMSGLLYLFWLDCVAWHTLPYTESLMLSGLCFLYYAILFFPKRWGLLLMILIAVVFSRPTGIAVLIGFIIFLAVHFKNKWLQIPDSVKVFLAILIIPVLLVPANFLLDRYDFTEAWTTGNIITYMDRLEGSQLYDASLRVKTDNLELAPENSLPVLKPVFFVVLNPIYFFKLACYKIWYLLSASRPYYSTTHNALNLIHAFTVYSCFIAGFRQSKNTPLKSMVITVMTLIILTTAISAVDWDNRFFIPMVPGFLLFAGGGFAILQNKVLGFANGFSDSNRVN